MTSSKRKRDNVDETEIRFWGDGNEFSALSIFWKTEKPVLYKGKTYATGEHMYQSLKFDYNGAPAANRAHVEAIRTAKTPSIAKRLTRRNKNSPEWAWQKKYRELANKYINGGSAIDPDWEKGGKIRAMEATLDVKFSQSKHSRDVLLGTGDRKIVENSPYDDYWGSGAKGDGQNRMGEMLERIRQKLRDEVK